MTVDAAGAPGRRATAVLSLRFCRGGDRAAAQPQARRRAAGLPASVAPDPGRSPRDRSADRLPSRPLASAHHPHRSPASAERAGSSRSYRQRWTIEQLFRTLKTHGFDIEALRIADECPSKSWSWPRLIAAVSVLQLVRARDGRGRAPARRRLRARRPTGSRSRLARPRRQDRNDRRTPIPKAPRLCRLGLRPPRRLDRLLRQTRPVVMLNGLIHFHAIKHGWTLPNV